MATALMIPANNTLTLPDVYFIFSSRSDELGHYMKKAVIFDDPRGTTNFCPKILEWTELDTRSVHASEFACEKCKSANFFLEWTGPSELFAGNSPYHWIMDYLEKRIKYIYCIIMETRIYGT